MAHHLPYITPEEYMQLSGHFGQNYELKGIYYGQRKESEDAYPKRIIRWEYVWRDAQTGTHLYCYPIFTLAADTSNTVAQEYIQRCYGIISQHSVPGVTTIFGATATEMEMTTGHRVKTLFLITGVPPIADPIVYDMHLDKFSEEVADVMRYIVPQFFDDITSGKLGLNYLDLEYTTKKVMQYMSHNK